MEDFAMYVDEYDYRRGTKFLELFPQMEKFYNRCKSLLVQSGRQRNLREKVIPIVPVAKARTLLG